MKKSALAAVIAIATILSACSKPSALPDSPTPSPTPQGAVAFVPILAVNTSDPSKGMVYLEDPASSERSPYLELSDLYSDHYHPVEYHAGNLFVIRRFDYTGPGDDDWRSELWVYDASKTGRKVFESKTLDFRASPDGLTAAVSDNERLYLMDTGGNAFAQLTPAQLGGNISGSPEATIDLEGWSDDGTRLWGSLFMASQILGFYETNATGGGIKSYGLASVPFSRQEYALNRSTGKLAFSDYPRFFDADSAEKFKTSGKTVTLYLLDLASMQLTPIATASAKEFHPLWLANDRLQYDDPNSAGQRLVYSLK